MFGSTARCVWILAAVATAGCGFKQSNVQPGGSGGGGAGGGKGGIGGGAGTTGIGGRGGMPIIIVTGGSTGADGGSASGTLDSNCGVKTQSAKMIPPDIMLVMDRSLSMTNDVNDKQCAGATGNNGNCGANSKWELMVPALNQVITATDGKVNWGMFYLGHEPAQCGVATAPVVPVVATNATAITTSLTGNPFNGYTGRPTCCAIQGVVWTLIGLADMNPNSCCSRPMGSRTAPPPPPAASTWTTPWGRSKRWWPRSPPASPCSSWESATPAWWRRRTRS